MPYLLIMEPTAPEQSDQPTQSVATLNSFPVEISESGELILGPNQTKEAYLTQLGKLKQSEATLQKAGYVLHPLTVSDLDQKKKCERCHKLMVKKAFQRRVDKRLKSGLDIVASAAANDQESAVAATAVGPRPPRGDKEAKHECRYHCGFFNGRIWSCCRLGAFGPPCTTSAGHKAAEYEPGELERLYRYYSTPPPSASSSVRPAVAIDCEMGTGMTNESLCIRVSVVDYFTSQVLVDQLVFPDEPILNYNTRFSGVSYGQMTRAKSRGECFFGIAAARDAIWKFVGPDTIVVAHSGQNDMNSLRWIHGNIVDTQLVESLPVIKLEKEAREKEALDKEAREKVRESESARGGKITTGLKPKESPVEGQASTDHQIERSDEPRKKAKGSGRFSLKSLTKERVGREIQHGSGGHDSVKDAIATRDVAHWNVVNLGHSFYEITSHIS